VVAACARPTAPPPRDRDRVAIVAAEKGSTGMRLVAIDERGDRQFDLLTPPGAIVRDTHPALSPDGRWLVFASSRGRALSETSLWIARAEPGAAPVRLTHGTAIDSHPTWRPDGRGIVFASTRDGGDFDLFELAIVDGAATGAPVQLTSGAGHEITPAVGRDGSVFYASVTPREGHEVESHLEVRAPDGTISRVTDGPGDTSPALSPDERTLVFARPVAHDTGPDAELWSMPSAAPQAAQPLLDLPFTDESGPVWSPDGRFVFATSVLRDTLGGAVFSSVIVIDMTSPRRTARLLEDRVGPVVRLTPAVARVTLDRAALDANPEYLRELARIVASALARQRP
jgi:Tol biopolymer transport system component